MDTERTALADAQPSGSGDQSIQLVRWTCNTGSNARSRGAVVLQGGEHRWQASAEGIGPVDALYRAVDSALHDVLTGHPRLISYHLEALTLGTEGVARVRVELAPPEAAEGARSSGSYEGIAQSAEHHRRVHRGLHRRGQPAPRGGALGGRHGLRRQLPGRSGRRGTHAGVRPVRGGPGHHPLVVVMTAPTAPAGRGVAAHRDRGDAPDAGRRTMRLGRLLAPRSRGPTARAPASPPRAVTVARWRWARGPTSRGASCPSPTRT